MITLQPREDVKSRVHPLETQIAFQQGKREREEGGYRGILGVKYFISVDEQNCRASRNALSWNGLLRIDSVGVHFFYVRREWRAKPGPA